MIHSIYESWIDLGIGRTGMRAANALPSGRTADARPVRNDLSGVVLAGVHQWGGCPLDRAMPRPLLPIANRPLIGYALDWLRAYGVKSACICANSHTPALQEAFSDTLWHGLDIDYYEDAMPRGPAGCVLDAAADLPGDLIVVVDGTVVPQIDLAAMLDIHESSEAALTVAVTRGGPVGNLGDAWLAPVGIYVFARRALKHVSGKGYQDIKEKLIPQLHEIGERVATFVVDGPAPRVTGTDSYLTVNGWTLEQVLRTHQPPPGYVRFQEAWVHETALIHAKAALHGPALVGPRSTFEDGATLVGPVTLGSECVVQEGAVICRSTLWDRCRIGAFSVLDRCILTSDVSVEPGSSLRSLACTEAGLWSSGGRKIRNRMR